MLYLNNKKYDTDHFNYKSLFRLWQRTAILFQQKGWNIIATMRSPEKETELNQLDNVLVTRLDVTDRQSVENAVKEGSEKFGNRVSRIFKERR